MKLGTFAATLGAAGFALIPVLAQNAQAPAPAAPTLADHYRGAFVCEAAPGATDILHVPIDLALRGKEVQFARPLFNLRGSRVMGSELGTGTIDASGNIHLQSAWEFRGVAVQGSYDGALTADSGALGGKQVWRTSAGATGSRACQIVVAPTYDGLAAAAN